MDTAHELVTLLKQAASDLGRKPTRDEFIRHVGISRHKIDCTFGGFLELCKATFGESSKKENSNKKLVSDFYTKSVEEIVSKQPIVTNLYSDSFTRTVCIPDLHFPWVDMNALTALYTYIELLKPERVIQLGDIYDMFSFAKFPKSKMIIKVDDEVGTSRMMAEDMWKTIRTLVPDAELIQICGNHDIRPMKRILETDCPELEAFFNFKSLFEFPGVTTFHDPREVVAFDGITYTHGHLKHGTHRGVFKSHVVHGHTHGGAITSGNCGGRYLFELDCGYMGNPNAPCFTYMPKKINNWQVGFGYISEHGPIFIPL